MPQLQSSTEFDDEMEASFFALLQFSGVERQLRPG